MKPFWIFLNITADWEQDKQHIHRGKGRKYVNGAYCARNRPYRSSLFMSQMLQDFCCQQTRNMLQQICHDMQWLMQSEPFPNLDFFLYSGLLSIIAKKIARKATACPWQGNLSSYSACTMSARGYFPWEKQPWFRRKSQFFGPYCCEWDGLRNFQQKFLFTK